MSQNFRRYTEIPYLLHLLETKEITLLSPDSWDDKNDTLYLEAYRRKKKLQSVLALCFTDASATYHHWKVFSRGSSGVCIEFDKSKLIDWARANGMSYDHVVYRSIKKAKEHCLAVDQYPFVKRHGFRDEREFRLIFECREKRELFKPFRFKLDMMTKITLNPWLPAAVCQSVERAIRKHLGSASMVIRQTTLLQNEEWLTKVNPDA